MKGEFSLSELADSIRGVCESMDIIYDTKQLPIKFGPDCYIFYATPQTQRCKEQGECRLLPYYAMTVGSKIDILYTKTMCD